MPLITITKCYAKVMSLRPTQKNISSYESIIFYNNGFNVQQYLQRKEIIDANIGIIFFIITNTLGARTEQKAPFAFTILQPGFEHNIYTYVCTICIVQVVTEIVKRIVKRTKMSKKGLGMSY